MGRGSEPLHREPEDVVGVPSVESSQQTLGDEGVGSCRQVGAVLFNRGEGNDHRQPPVELVYIRGRQVRQVHRLGPLIRLVAAGRPSSLSVRGLKIESQLRPVFLDQ